MNIFLCKMNFFIIINTYKSWINEMAISNIEIEKYKTVLKNITDFKNNCNYVKDEIFNMNKIKKPL